MVKFFYPFREVSDEMKYRKRLFVVLKDTFSASALCLIGCLDCARVPTQQAF